MDKHISLSPCPFCGMGLTLDIDEEGGAAILHSLKGEKNCWFPSIVEIEMPVETTLEEMVEILNRRPIQESFEHALVGTSLVAAARLQDKYFEIQDLNAEIDRLKAERRWIPVSERLPEVGELVNCAYKVADKYYTVRARMNKLGKFKITQHSKPVTHWMPLPAEPPSEEEC